MLLNITIGGSISYKKMEYIYERIFTKISLYFSECISALAITFIFKLIFLYEKSCICFFYMSDTYLVSRNTQMNKTLQPLSSS